MKALVTGGAGFIGSHVIQALLDRQADVLALDDLSGGFEENIPDGARFVRGSIVDSALVERLFAEEKFDYVFHLAAYAAEGLSHFIREFNYTNNVVGSMSVINACVRHPVKCLVFTSSIAVYGANQVPMLEETVPAPEDPYGIAKYAVEMDLVAARRMFGLNSIVFRPHNVYGERQNIGDRYRNVIGIFMNQIMRGEPLTVFGDGEQQRHHIHHRGRLGNMRRGERLDWITHSGAVRSDPAVIVQAAELHMQRSGHARFTETAVGARVLDGVAPDGLGGARRVQPEQPGGKDNQESGDPGRDKVKHIVRASGNHPEIPVSFVSVAEHRIHGVDRPI